MSLYEAWVAAESFFYNTLLIVALSLIIGFIVYIFVLSYANPEKSTKKIATISYVALILISAGYCLVEYRSHAWWLEQHEYVNPAMRPWRPLYGSRTWETPQMVDVYKQGRVLANDLSQSLLYEGVRVQEPIDQHVHVGELENSHQFETEQGRRYSMIKEFIRTDTEEAYLEGIQFQLVDERFEEIGFSNDLPVIFQYFYYPEDRLTTDSVERRAMMDTAEDIFSNWNMRRLEDFGSVE